MSKIYLIGEVGINANGDIDLAKQLIRQISECGWNVVKFQKRDIDTVYTQEFLDSPRESPWGTTQRQQKEGLEWSKDQLAELFGYADLWNLDVGCSAWDMKSLVQVNNLKPSWHKVASPFVTNLEFLRKVASFGKLTYISTGMSTMADIANAVNVFDDAKCPYVLLHLLHHPL